MPALCAVRFGNGSVAIGEAQCSEAPVAIATGTELAVRRGTTLANKCSEAQSSLSLGWQNERSNRETIDGLRKLHVFHLGLRKL